MAQALPRRLCLVRPLQDKQTSLLYGIITSWEPTITAHSLQAL